MQEKGARLVVFSTCRLSASMFCSAACQIKITQISSRDEISHVQAEGACLVAVSSVKGCRLPTMCDMAVHLPLERQHMLHARSISPGWSSDSEILHVQAKGARLVAVSSVKGCRLSAMCDMAVHLPLERELCPFDLAPVTSTAAQMLFGDTVAIALMQVWEDAMRSIPDAHMQACLIMGIWAGCRCAS